MTSWDPARVRSAMAKRGLSLRALARLLGGEPCWTTIHRWLAPGARIVPRADVAERIHGILDLDRQESPKRTRPRAARTGP